MPKGKSVGWADSYLWPHGFPSALWAVLQVQRIGRIEGVIMKRRTIVKPVGLLLIGGACGWGLSALVPVIAERGRVETLRTADWSAAMPAALDLVDNREAIAILVDTLQDSGAPSSIPAKNRMAAANALSSCDGLREPMLALSRAAVEDPDAEVRLECVRLVADFTHDRLFRGLRTIAQSLPTETDKQVLQAKRQLLTMAVFTDEGEVATRRMSPEELSRECRSRLGEAVREADARTGADGETR